MRVGLDVTPLIGHRTGVGAFVAHLLGALEALADPPEVVGWALTARADAVPAGSRRFPYPARLALPLWGHAGHPSGRRTLRGLDVVHGTNFVAPPTGLPTVITIHDLTFLDTRPAFVPVVRRLLGRGAWVHAPSQAVAEAVTERLGCRRIEVIPHGPTSIGPDDPSVRLPDIDGRPFVLAVGAADRRRNLPRLVQAFDEAHAAEPGLHLVLAGAAAGPDAGAVRLAVSTLAPGARARVHVLGPVPAPVRDALVHRAAVLAVPSLDEGFGFPVLEAQQVGTPVVASTAGALPEVAGAGAVLVDPRDVAGLASALLTALDDPALVERGRANVARFSWAGAAAALASLYGRCR